MSETINILVEQNIETVRISAVETTNQVAVNVNEANELVNVKVDLIGQKGDKGDSAEPQIQSDWAQTDDTQVDYIKNKPTVTASSLQDVTDEGSITTNSITVDSPGYFSIIEPFDLGTENKDTNSYAYLSGNGIIGVSNGTIEGQIRNTDTTEGIILEFPDKGTGSYTIATTDDITTQVNADWNSTSGLSEILNKPSIPTNTSDLINDGADGVNPFITLEDIPAETPQVQSDWNQIVIGAVDYIKNKPTIPSAQINSDWNAVTGVAQILNKPTIPTATSQLSNDSGYITNVVTSLGYTPENTSNKSTSTSLGTSDTLFPTQNAVKTYVDTSVSGVQIDLLQVQVFS